MSINGNVEIGKWEYLSSAQAILIDRIKDKILLNQSFINKAILVLNKDGLNNQPFILANESIIPDLNVEKYLRELMYEKLNIKAKSLVNGEIFEIHNEYTSLQFEEIGMKVTLDGGQIEDGKYTTQKKDRNYEILNGKISRITVPVFYETSVGTTLTIEQEYKGSIMVGDLVYVDQELAKTGKYKIGFLNTITIENGIITKLWFF